MKLKRSSSNSQCEQSCIGIKKLLCRRNHTFKFRKPVQNSNWPHAHVCTHVHVHVDQGKPRNNLGHLGHFGTWKPHAWFFPEVPRRDSKFWISRLEKLVVSRFLVQKFCRTTFFGSAVKTKFGSMKPSFITQKPTVRMFWHSAAMFWTKYLPKTPVFTLITKKFAELDKFSKDNFK